jgi:hypothetical protein
MRLRRFAIRAKIIVTPSVIAEGSGTTVNEIESPGQVTPQESPGITPRSEKERPETTAVATGYGFPEAYPIGTHTPTLLDPVVS